MQFLAGSEGGSVAVTGIKARILTGVAPYDQEQTLKERGLPVAAGSGPTAAMMLLAYYSARFGYRQLLSRTHEALAGLPEEPAGELRRGMHTLNDCLHGREWAMTLPVFFQPAWNATSPCAMAVRWSRNTAPTFSAAAWARSSSIRASSSTPGGPTCWCSTGTARRASFRTSTLWWWAGAAMASAGAHRAPAFLRAHRNLGAQRPGAGAGRGHGIHRLRLGLKGCRTKVRHDDLPQFTAIVRAFDTGFFLPSVSVSTPCSSLALLASASISSGSS